MKSFLIIASLLVTAFVIFAVPPLVLPYVDQYGAVAISDMAKAILLCALLAAIFGYGALRQKNGDFLLNLFICALLVRVLLSAFIFIFNGQNFFGGDAFTYDSYGYALMNAWRGDRYFQSLMADYFRELPSGWGMIYMVAGVYGLIGRNMLAIQLVNAVLGAATPVIVYLCAFEVFKNIRVARFAAVIVAFYPSLVLWSSQGLKDGPVVFFLSLSILLTLKLTEKFNLKQIILLGCSLFALLSLRFYIFYMITVAIAGAFVIGTMKLTLTNFVRQSAVMIVLGLAFTYFGITRVANVQLGALNLERVQASRLDLSQSAQSGFGKEVDVSTSEGALSTIPLGLVYLLFAPFPWQLASLRQSITLPEMVLWWLSFPLLILGAWFSIRYRLRQMSPILIFTLMLSLAYSIFQGNVGTAYRQRSQLLVFYFIFVAVGCVLLLEKREERRRRDFQGTRPAPVRIGGPELFRQ
jgi:Dolichyl-phosphate-mannose-protein mannosyltransferase